MLKKLELNCFVITLYCFNRLECEVNRSIDSIKFLHSYYVNFFYSGTFFFPIRQCAAIGNSEVWFRSFQIDDNIYLYICTQFSNA